MIAYLPSDHRIFVSFLEYVIKIQEFMQNASKAIQDVSDRYQLDLTDAERWFHSTEWAIHGWVSDKMIHSVIYHLKIAGIIRPDKVIPELIWKRDSISSN